MKSAFRFTLVLGVMLVLSLAACAGTSPYAWESATMKGGTPAKVAVLPFVGRMDVELNIERAVARFFQVHASAVRPGVTYIRLPRVAEETPFPEGVVTRDKLDAIENRIFFSSTKAELYDILDKTGHDYAIYVQADPGGGGTEYIVAVFDAATRSDVSETGPGAGGLDTEFPRVPFGVSETEITYAIERCFARLAKL